MTGGYGATTDGNDGANGRRGEVALLECLEPKKKGESLAIHAATGGILGRGVCAGGTTSLSGIRQTATNHPDLQNYLKGLQGKTPSQWENFFARYTPREVFVKGDSKGLFWGEDCRGQRHFDCMGLVNFCFERAGVERNCSHDIPQWLEQTVEVEEPQAGDLLIKYTGPKEHQHIGIVTGMGKIVQAASTFTGVHATSDVDNPHSKGRKGDPACFFTNLRRYKAWVHT